ncbi:MAG: Rpn family recombination-promoting nuclease/putative transposase [Spirochaetota bacterium]
MTSSSKKHSAIKGRWRKRDFSAYFDTCDQAVRRFLPEFDYLLTDLSKFTDREIKEVLFHRLSLRITLLLLKNIFFEKRLVTYLKDYLEIGRLYYREERGLRFLEAVIRYLLSGTDIETKEIVRAVSGVSKTTGEVVMSTAERLMKQGFKEGIEKGIEKGTLLDKQNVLIKQLSKKFGITDEEKSFIRSVTDTIKLDHALDEILFADSKETVLDKIRD